MDLSQYNPTPASDTAQRFEVIDPFSGHPIKDENGEALAYSVVGMQSTIARNEDARIRREFPKPPVEHSKMSDKQRAAYDEEVAEYAQKAGCQKIARMITALHGEWEYQGTKLTANDKELLAGMFDSQDWLVNQINANASNIRAYRPKTLRG